MGNLKSIQALILLLLNLGTLLISLACADCPYSTLLSKSLNLSPKYPPKVKPQVAKLSPTILKPPPHVPKPPTGKPPHISKLTLYFSWGYHYAYPHIPPYSKPPRLPKHPFVHPPPIRPELPFFATLSITPKPPIVYPPIIPIPPITLTPPITTPPPPSLETLFHPPPPHVPKPPRDMPKPPSGHPPPKPPIVYLPITPKPPIVYSPMIPTPPITLVITPPPRPPVVPQPPPETPSPPPPPHETPCPPPPPEICPTLKLDACIDKLGALVHVEIDSKAKDTCCPVFSGLLDMDAAFCLCTTIKAKLLNINIIIPIALQVLVDCGKTLPSSFHCAA